MNWPAAICVILLALISYIWGRLDGRDKWKKQPEPDDETERWAAFALFLQIQVFENQGILDPQEDMETKIQKATLPFITNFALFKSKYKNGFGGKINV